MKNTTDADKSGKGHNEEMILGGNIALVGFEILDPAELIIVKKIVGGYVKKMGNSGDYQDMRLVLQQHPHGKSFKHEIVGKANFKEGQFNSNAMEWNLYTAISQVCDGILEGVVHARRKEDEHKIKTQG